jgi:CheY-like chemotaxis protein
MNDPAIGILIVDDEPSTRTMLSTIFSGIGHSVRCAEDGFSGLQRIRERMPDVILSDLNMPGMSGFEFLSVVRLRFPAIYVIATSGSFTGDQVPREIAADAFYEKAAGLGRLFKLMSAASQRVYVEFAGARRAAPQWIARSVETGSHAAHLTIACHECLRTFPDTPHHGEIVHTTVCIYCDAAIEYSIIQPTHTSARRALPATVIPIDQGRHYQSGAIPI